MTPAEAHDTLFVPTTLVHVCSVFTSFSFRLRHHCVFGCKSPTFSLWSMPSILCMISSRFVLHTHIWIDTFSTFVRNKECSTTAHKTKLSYATLLVFSSWFFSGFFGFSIHQKGPLSSGTPVWRIVCVASALGAGCDVPSPSPTRAPTTVGNTLSCMFRHRSSARLLTVKRRCLLPWFS